MANKKTYYAAADLTIERLSIKRGDVLGEGEVPPAGQDPSGTFKAGKGLELIDAGHIQAGIETGRIVTEKPKPLPPSDAASVQAKRERRAREEAERARREQGLEKQVQDLTAERDEAAERVKQLEADLKAAQDEAAKAGEEVARLNQEIDKAQAAAKSGGKASK